MNYTRLRRIYASTLLIENNTLTLTEHLHYIKNVLRLTAGASFRIFNERDGEFLATIQEIDKKVVVISIARSLKKPAPETKLTLGLSIIKPDKMEKAIDMAVQLGVTEIVPIIADRSQLRTINNLRLLKTITASAKQSERVTIPQLTDPLTIGALTDISCGIIIYANETENVHNNIYNLLGKISISDIITLIIGPEGGFSETEAKMLANIKNAHSISLGANILRVETAVAAGLAQVQLMKSLQVVKSRI